MCVYSQGLLSTASRLGVFVHGHSSSAGTPPSTGTCEVPHLDARVCGQELLGNVCCFEGCVCGLFDACGFGQMLQSIASRLGTLAQPQAELPRGGHPRPLAPVGREMTAPAGCAARLLPGTCPDLAGLCC